MFAKRQILSNLLKVQRTYVHPNIYILSAEYFQTTVQFISIIDKTFTLYTLFYSADVLYVAEKLKMKEENFYIVKYHDKKEMYTGNKFFFP